MRFFTLFALFYALLPPESCQLKLPQAPRTYKVMNHLLKVEVLYIISYDRLKEYNDILFFVVVKFPDSKINKRYFNWRDMHIFVYFLILTQSACVVLQII